MPSGRLHSGFPEGFLVWVFPHPRPRPRFVNSPSCVFFGCKGVDPSMQMVPQRGQDVMDCFPSLLWPARQETRRPSQQVDTVTNVPDLLMRCLVSHKFHGRFFHLWVRPWQAAPVASADEPLCLLLPSLGSVWKHLMEDNRLNGELLFPI